jgi:hypothetical protein
VGAALDVGRRESRVEYAHTEVAVDANMSLAMSSDGGLLSPNPATVMNLTTDRHSQQGR